MITGEGSAHAAGGRPGAHLHAEPARPDHVKHVDCEGDVVGEAKAVADLGEQPAVDDLRQQQQGDGGVQGVRTADLRVGTGAAGFGEGLVGVQ